MLPEGWKRRQVSDLVSRVDAGVSVNGEDRPISGGEKGVLKVSCVSSGVFLPSQHKAIHENEILRAKVSPKADRLIVSRSNTAALVGASAYIPIDYPDLYLSDKLWQLEPVQPQTVNMRWLAFWFASDSTREMLAKLGTGSSGSMKNISKEELLGLNVLTPSLVEQDAIAQVLCIWENAIATSEKLLANSRRHRKALTTVLFREKRRLLGGQAWQKQKISDLIAESRIPGSAGDTARKITVKLYGRGVVSKSERRLGSDATQYYRRKTGQFIYSKLDFLNGAFGIIPAELDGYESTLDLPAFDFLDGVEPRWFLHYISREDFYLGHLGLANGGRKARRVNPSDLLQVIIDVPELAEQRKIAEAIDTAIADEKALERMVVHLKTEKRVLMEDLLTGKRRVRIPAMEEEASAA